MSRGLWTGRNASCGVCLSFLTRQILKTEQEAVTGTMSICMRYYGKIKADEEGVDIDGRQE